VLYHTARANGFFNPFAMTISLHRRRRATARSPLTVRVCSTVYHLGIFAAVASCGGGGADGPNAPSTPSIASVTVSPATPSLAIGATMQLTATGIAANGASVSGVSWTWTSSAQNVATVSNTGLVTAVAAGTALIMASSSGSAGSTTITVQSPAFNPAASTALSGTQNFQAVNIPSGVTVTASSALDLNVAGDATIAGTLTGNCVRLRVTGRGRVTVSGTISNVCTTPSDAPGEIRIVGASYSFTNATVTTQGGLTITNDTTLTAANFLAVAALDAARRAPGQAHQQGAAGCSLNGFNNAGPAAKSGADGERGEPGLPGRNFFLSCRGDLLITGSELNGGTAGAGARGGRGGDGGRVSLIASGSIVFGTGVKLRPGKPGDGGDATATATAPSGTASATGGAGGHLGDAGGDGPITLRAGGALSSAANVVYSIPSGSRGGTAEARGTNGLDAANGQPAGHGGSASATSGAPGDVRGQLVMTAPGGLAGWNYSFADGRPSAGSGGLAQAFSGNGGRGDAANPNGGRGGDATALTQNGGNASAVDNNGRLFGFGGDGGYSRFEGGRGGDGFSDCVAGSVVSPGGAGGRGGSATSQASAGGVGQFPTRAGDNGVLYFGRGGRGGSGWNPGPGGAAGADLTKGEKQTLEDSFIPGTNGTPCPASAVSTAWSVLSDPNLHDPLVRFRTITGLAFITTASGGITIAGASPWVSVTGTIDATGLITAEGFGTVAGCVGTRVQVSGRITNGLFQGTVTAGNQTPFALPGGPISYNVGGQVRVP
jgi:hypothetical protein